MKYYIIACFQDKLKDKEVNDLRLSEFVNSEDDETLPDYVYKGSIMSDKSVDSLTEELKSKIISVVSDNLCFLSLSTDRHWKYFKC